MLGLLRFLIPILVASLVGLVLYVLVRELVRGRQRKAWQKEIERCRTLIGQLESLKVEEVIPLANELNKSFPLSLIEQNLDQFRTKTTTPETRQKLAGLYGHLGIVEHHLKVLQEAKSWTERANAAEKLGEMGHVSSVLPLIAVLSNPNEDAEVKSVAVRSLGEIRDERAIEPLLAALGSPDPATGQPLADVLARFGELVVEPLKKVLSASRVEPQRFWAARILGQLKIPTVAQALLKALADHSPKVRSEAARSLGLIHLHEAVSPLTKLLLEDPDPLVREAASEALGLIANERALGALKEALADLDPMTRRRAMEALERMGEKSTPFFLEALHSDSREAATQAASALERLGLVTAEVERLTGKDWESAFELLRLIAKCGVVETIARSLGHVQVRVRIHLCRILSEAASPRTLEALSDLAQKDPEWGVRLEALLALTRLANPLSVPLLSVALKKEEETLREELLTGLQKAPLSFVEGLQEVILPLLQDENVKVRVESVKVLARMQQTSLSLISSLADANPQVRREAAIGLGNFVAEGNRSAGRQTTEALMNVLNDSDREVRMAAVKTLGALRDSTAVPSLAQCFEWADDEEREVVCRSIAAVPQQELFSLIDELMGLVLPKARAGVAWTLGLLQEEKAVSLALFFLRDHEAVVRAAAAGGVGNWFEKNGMRDSLHASRDLIPFLADPNERVRAAVANALGKIADPEAADSLVALLTTEPDRFVCQRAVAAVGCLFVRPGEGVTSRPTRPVSLLKNWLEGIEDTSVEDEVSKMAGLISLVMLQDEEAIGQGIQILQSPSKTRILKAFLKSLPKQAEAAFLHRLSFDPSLFWRDEIGEKEVSGHYRNLLLTSHSAKARIHALRALGELKGPAALGSLQGSFEKDPNPGVRAQALAILAQRLTGGPLIDRMLAAVQDPSEQVRREVAPILTRISLQEIRGCREKLIPLLDSPEIRSPVATLLSRLFRDDWQILADALLGTARKSRILGMIETLGKIGDAGSSELFFRFLGSRDTEIREASVHWAQEAGLLSEEKLSGLLEDPQESVRASAVRGLGRHLKTSCLDLLLSRLQDPSPHVRIELAVALGRTRLAGDERPVRLLEQLTADLNPPVRIQSLVSLFRLGVTGTAKRAEQVILDLETNERDDLLKRLDREGILLDLTSRLEHERNAALRKEAVEFLSALDLSHFKQTIAEALQDPASEVRLAAIEALGPIEDPVLQQAVAALAQDPVEEVRNAVKRRKLRSVK